ncbi:MAG: PP2C family protein-serine/threonine phosphatase [bacterium]
MTLRTRLTLYLNGLLVGTLALVAGAGMWLSSRGLRERAKQDAMDTASLLANAGTIAVAPTPRVEPPADGWPSAEAKAVAACKVRLAERDAWRRMAATLSHSPSDVANFQTVYVAEGNGQLLAWHSRFPKQDVASEYWHGVDSVVREARETGLPAAAFLGGSLVAAVPLQYKDHDGWVFACQFSTDRFRDMTASASRKIAGLTAIGLLGGALLSSMLARRISRPVHDLAAATKVIGEGEFDHRVKVRSNDELGVLAESFNRMAESLETSMEGLARAAAEREAQHHEMRLAADMQESFLPASCPQMGDFEVAARSIPAREVGGDFYDFIPLPDGRWGIVVADVAGKGLPAAMFMGFSRCLIRAYSRERPSTVDVLQMTSDFMLHDVNYDMFVTCFYAVLDPEHGSVSYVNAGHNPGLVTQGQQRSVTLPASGVPLGVIEQEDMRQDPCQLSVGDVMLLYTDGITEATDAHGEQFGLARLREVLRNARGLSSQEICERAITAVQTFAQGKSQFDDMTVVVIKALGPVRAESSAGREAADVESAPESPAIS